MGTYSPFFLQFNLPLPCEGDGTGNPMTKNPFLVDIE